MIHRMLTFVALLSASTAWAAEPNPTLTQTVKTHFKTWDLNANGELSLGEIELAIANPEVKGAAAAAAVSLRRGIKSKANTVMPLTLEKLTQAVPKRKDSPGVPDFESMFQSALDRIQKSPRDMFLNGDPNIDHLHQGRLGNCFCLAPLGAALQRDPKFLNKMFTTEKDGTIRVRFGNGETVSVKPPTDGELALFASTSQTGIWCPIYEKAVGQLRLNSKTEVNPDRPTALSVASAGSAGEMIVVLTGHSIQRFSCSPWRSDKPLDPEKEKILLNQLREQLATATKERRLITFGTGSGLKTPGVLGLHAYAVLGYDAKADTAMLWNPHGNTFEPKGTPGLANGYPTKLGRFTIPLSEVVHLGGGFAFEQEK